MTLLTLLLAIPQPAIAARPPGDFIEPAVIVDVTPAGLASLDVLAAGVLPESLALPVIAAADAAPRECVLFGTICWIPWRYDYEISGFDLDVAIDDLSLVPGTDVLELNAEVTLAVASQASPGLLAFGAEAADIDLFSFLTFTVIDIDETCDVWLEPTPLGLQTTLTLRVTPQPGGTPTVEVSVAPVDLSLDLSGLRIDGCAIGFLDEFVDAVAGFIGFFNFDIYEILAGLIEPIVDGFISDFLGDLEGTLEDLLATLVIEQELDLLGATLRVGLEPSELVIRPAGLRFALAGSVSGDGFPDPCVSAFGIDGSLQTGGGLPAIGAGLPGLAHHVGALVDDDLVNQALFAAWYEGLLCFTLDPSSDDLGISLPIPLDTSLLGLLSDGLTDELFPKPEPILIATRPTRPPEARTGGEADLDVVIEGLGVDIYASLDDRLTRVVGIDVGAEVGVDVAFDGATGQLGVDLDLDDAFAFGVGYNELVPAASAPITEGLSGLVDSLLGTILGGLLDSLEFALPSLSGVGVAAIEVGGAGPDGDFLGVFGTLAEVPYDNGDLLTGGCDGGCAGGGCAGGGCDHGGAPPPVFFLMPLVLAFRRRTP